MSKVGIAPGNFNKQKIPHFLITCRCSSTIFMWQYNIDIIEKLDHIYKSNSIHVSDACRYAILTGIGIRNKNSNYNYTHINKFK